MIPCLWNRLRRRLCPVRTRVRVETEPGVFSTITVCIHGRVTVGSETWLMKDYHE